MLLTGPEGRRYRSATVTVVSSYGRIAWPARFSRKNDIRADDWCYKCFESVIRRSGCRRSAVNIVSRRSNWRWRGEFMSRSFVLILVAGIVVAAGCSNQKAAPPAAVAQPVASTQTSAPPAPVAVADSVAEVPDYPGAVRTAVSQGSETEHGFVRKSEASWTSTDPYATVVAYYQRTIIERGWTVTGTESKATETELRMAKGTSVGKVEVKQRPGMQVTIKVERSDR